MQRRDTLRLMGLALLMRAGTFAAAARAHPTVDPNGPRPKIALLIYPDMVLLDLVPAHTVFALTMGDVQLVSKDLTPVRTDLGITIQPTATFADCEHTPDVLCIPGGLKGTVGAMNDAATVDFVAAVGARARYVTSVCTGSLLLGAAGLLQGYRATGHWQSRYALTQLGAILSDERVVVDRNRITSGGVTAGLDFGLLVAARLRGEEWAKTIQLVLEYAPAPPFDAGTVATASPEVTKIVNQMLAAGLPPLDRAIAVAKARLRL